MNSMVTTGDKKMYYLDQQAYKSLNTKIVGDILPYESCETYVDVCKRITN